MARLAKALYETGLGPREVLRECYGVPFPNEFFVLADARPVLMFEYTYQPWDLAVPLDRGGPPQGRTDDLETDIFARDTDLVPLGVIHSIGTAFGGVFWCYRVTELAAGRPTISTIEYDVTPDSPVTLLAESLLAALHQHHAEGAASLERERARTLGHRGGGGDVDDEEVETARLFVARIEELQHRVG